MQPIDRERAARDAEARVLVDWMLKPNCSASPRQFVYFYLSLASFSLAIATALCLKGIWFILPFTGVELLVVAIAFILYARHAVDYEHIQLWSDRLLIERMDAERLTRYEFNPRWVRVKPGVTPRDHVVLCSHGKSVAIGQNLALHRRAQFARELRSWLRRCG